MLFDVIEVSLIKTTYIRYGKNQTIIFKIFFAKCFAKYSIKSGGVLTNCKYSVIQVENPFNFKPKFFQLRASSQKEIYKPIPRSRTMAPRSVNPHSLPNYLITIFSDIASNLNRNIPHSKYLFVEIPRSTRGKFIFLLPSDSEVIVNLIRWQKNKSTDLMNIPVFIYEFLASLISPTVSMLFNNTLSEGIFPECFKTAKLFPFSIW